MTKTTKTTKTIRRPSLPSSSSDSILAASEAPSAGVSHSLPLDEVQTQLAALTRRVEQVESMAHTDHTLSPEVIEHIATTALAKMVTHFSTLLKMGDTLLSK